MRLSTVGLTLAIAVGIGAVGGLYLDDYLGTEPWLTILGVLLAFAGLQLALMIEDLRDRKSLFVALFMLGLALAFNLAVAFIAGITVAYVTRSDRIRV